MGDGWMDGSTFISSFGQGNLLNGVCTIWMDGWMDDTTDGWMEMDV